MEIKQIPDQKAFSPEKMKKVNLFETDRMFTDIYCFEPGQVQKPHTHEGADKIYCVLEGRGRFQVGREQRHLGPLEITLAPSGVEHGVVNDGPGRLVVLVFMAPHPDAPRLPHPP
ncbi:MAG: cupin domain-containing protein [Planctomycetes bacterium]|nr:cupin domain-containing protein [Planctomycetota bacterium]